MTLQLLAQSRKYSNILPCFLAPTFDIQIFCYKIHHCNMIFDGSGAFQPKRLIGCRSKLVSIDFVGVLSKIILRGRNFAKFQMKNLKKLDSEDDEKKYSCTRLDVMHGTKMKYPTIVYRYFKIVTEPRFQRFDIIRYSK